MTTRSARRPPQSAAIDVLRRLAEASVQVLTIASTCGLIALESRPEPRSESRRDDRRATAAEAIISAMLVRVLGADDRGLEGDCAPFRVAPSRVWSTTVASTELVDVVEVLGIIAIADEQRVGLVTCAARVKLQTVTSRSTLTIMALNVH